MRLKVLHWAGIAIVFAIVPASAHHSFAMFDANTTRTISGTVTSFQWTNPHSWIDISVNNKKGQAEKWSFEMGSPASLAKIGLKPKSIMPGDKVTVTYHPLKDGMPGGQFLSVKLPNGQSVAEPPRARPRAPGATY
jgi:hypothetical protein